MCLILFRPLFFLFKESLNHKEKTLLLTVKTFLLIDRRVNALSISGSHRAASHNFYTKGDT